MALLDEDLDTLAAQYAAPRRGLKRIDWAGEGLPLAPPASDAEREVQATGERFSNRGTQLRAMANQLMGDTDEAARLRSDIAASDARADALDSGVSTDLLSSDDKLSSLRKLAIQSTPDMALALAGAGVGRGVARQAALGAEARALARNPTQELSQAAAKVRPSAAAATPEVAALQRQEALQKAARSAVRGDTAAMGRVDRAGRAGGYAGGTAGALPGLLAEQNEFLQEHPGQADAAKVLAAATGAAALDYLPLERLMGRAFSNPAVRQAFAEANPSLGRQLARRATTAGKRVAGQAGMEGLTEAGQAVLQRAGQKWVDNNVQLLSREALDDYMVNFVAGAALGGVMGAGVDAPQAVAGGTADTARWAWDRSGALREQVRANLAKPWFRGQQDGPQRPRVGEPMGPSGGGSGDAGLTASDVLQRVQGTLRTAGERVGPLADKARSTAADAFQRASAALRTNDDLDARADAVMDDLDGATNAEQDSGVPIGQRPGMIPGQRLRNWALSKVNPDYLTELGDGAAGHLGNALNHLAGGARLTAPQRSLVVQALNAGALTSNDYETIRGFGPIIAEKSKAMSRTAGNELGTLKSPQFNVTNPREVLDEGENVDHGIERVVGLNEQRGDRELSPIDRTNSAREGMRAAHERGDEESRVEQRDAGRAAFAESREKLLKGLTTDENRSSTKAAQHYDSRKAQAGFVELADKVDKSDGRGKVMRGQLVNLAMLIKRQQDAMRREGTPHEGIKPRDALLRGLSELAQAGAAINPDTLTKGNIVATYQDKAGNKTRDDEHIMYLSAKDIAAIKGVLAKPTQKDVDISPRDPDKAAARLDKDFANATRYETEDNPEPVTAADEDRGVLRARDTPPGEDMGGGTFTPSNSPVSSVSFDGRYAEHLNAWRRERDGRPKGMKLTEWDPGWERGAPVPTRATPAQRAAIDRRYGELIGADDIKRQIDSGTLSGATAEKLLVRLKDPSSKLALRYLKHAVNGELGAGETTVGVRHMPSDKEAPAKGEKNDDWGTQVKPSSTRREFVTRTPTEAKAREEAEKDGPSSRVAVLEERPVGEYNDPPAPSKKNEATAKMADARSKAMRAAKYPNGRPTKPKAKKRVVKKAEVANAEKDPLAGLDSDSRKWAKSVVDQFPGAYRGTPTAEHAAKHFTVQHAIESVGPYGETTAVLLYTDHPTLADAKTAMAKSKADLGATLLSRTLREDGAAKLVDAVAQTQPDAHDHAAEGGLVNALLKALGYSGPQYGQYSVASAPEGKAGDQNYKAMRVRLGDSLTGRERIEVLAHETGHAVVTAEISRATGIPVKDLRNPDGSYIGPADWMPKLKEVNPELYNALQADYTAWKQKYGSPIAGFTDMRLSRSPAARGARLRRDARALGKTEAKTGELPGYGYQVSMNEWLADNIARALLQDKRANSIVGQFFGKIAAQLKRAYTLLFKGKQAARWAPAPSVNAWIKSLFDAQVAAVRAAEGQTVPQATADAAVTASVATAGSPPAPPTPPGAGAAPNLPPEEFNALREYVRVILPPEAKQVLTRAFSTLAANKLFRELFPEVIEQINDAQDGMTARIAAGYMLWKAGADIGGPKTQGTLGQWKAKLLELFNLASPSDYAQRIMYDMAKGVVAQKKADRAKYDFRAYEARSRGNLQKAVNAVGDVKEKIFDPINRVLESNTQQAFESGIPSWRKIASALYKPQGYAGSDRGMVRDAVHRVALFADQAAKIMGPLSGLQRRRVMDLLQRQAGEAELTRASKSDPNKQAHSAKVQEAVREVRKLMDESLKYMRNSGVQVGYTQNYYPIQLDIRDDATALKLQRLLERPHFEEVIRNLDQFAKRDKDGNKHPSEVPIAELIGDLVEGARRSQRPAKTGAGAPNFTGANQRLMGFIYKVGTPQDIKDFAALQTKNPAESFSRYFEPMVKRAEYARRFGDNGSKLNALLKKMQEEGATPEQIQQAKDSVEAALGVYGSELSPVLNAISPALAKRFSGDKTRATIDGLQAYQNARLLPLALLSSLVDPAGIMVRAGGDAGIAWRGFRDGLKSLYNKSSQAQLEDMLRMLGASGDMATQEALNQMFGGAGSKFSQKVNEFVFKWNGMSAWVRATRYMALNAGHEFLLNHGGRRPNEHSARYLEELGLKAGDIAPQVVKQPDGSERVLVDLNTGDAARDARVRQALMDFVDGAILRPNSQQSPLWHSDPFMGLVTQYKSFAYAFYDQIMGRIDTEMRNGNAKVLLSAAAYLPVVIMAEMARNALQGDSDDTEDWDLIDWTKMGIERSGFVSPKLDVAFDSVEDVQRNRLPGSSQIGATPSQARNVYQALEGRRDKGKELEAALPASALWRKWNDGPRAAAGEA